MNARPPLLSAVICVRGAARGLPRALEALCRQSLEREAFEVVVVDDATPDGSISAAARAFESRLDVRCSRQRPAGIASARNHGLFLARGGVVLFLDDEEAADEDLLRRHLEAHRRWPEPRFAVVGRAELDPAIGDDPLMRFVLEACAQPPPGPETTAGVPLDWTHFQTGRSSCKRRFLLEQGIFASGFRSAGEDAELAYRLSRRGFAVVYEPGAVTRILEGRTLDEVCARARDAGEALALFARLHRGPEVEAWTGAASAPARWRELAPAYDSILRSARALDGMARVRQESALPLDAFERSLLHRSYAAALDASAARGMIGSDGELAGATSAPPRRVG